MIARPILVLALLAAAGCAAEQGLVRETPQVYLAERGLIDRPTPAAFSFCVDHACARVVEARLSPAEWLGVVGPLATPSRTPAAERLALADAVGRFEATVRHRLGLRPDKAGTYPGAFAADQNDCVDETANTTTLLLMLNAAGALAHHRVGSPAKRGVFVNIALPHRSATLVEKTGAPSAGPAHYVLDSWFRASGAPADIAPLADWLEGWTPPGGAWS